MKKKINQIFMILLCIILIFSLAACHPQQSQGGNTIYQAGSYTASANGKNGPLTVEVVFSSERIESVKVLDHSETPGFAETPIEKVPEKIVSDQTIAVETITGATYTSEAILAAVEDCVKQAGGDIATLKTKENTVSNKVEEVSYDIVVVGAGAAGSSAALAASEKSDKVLLLEKTATPMGAGTLAGGLFAADSNLQKKTGKTVDKEWLYNEYMKSSAGYMNSNLVRTIIEESGKTVDWLMENGMKLNLIDPGTGGAFVHIGMPTTLHGYAEGGTVAITNLIKKFEENGGTVMFSTPATELLKDSEGKITGVLARKEDGTTLRINAKAVIIATGGYAGNEEMMKEYIGSKYTFGQILTNTGDGIKMAWSAGADEYGIGTMHYFAQNFTPQETEALVSKLGPEFWNLTKFSYYPHLRVNTHGQRFSDETLATNFAIHSAQLHMQPKQTEYLILDSAVLEQIAQRGYASVEEHYSTFKNNRNFYMEFNEPCDTDELIKQENTPTDYVPLLEKALGTGVVFKGKTIEELANNMGVDASVFSESVAQFNNAIKTGKDDLFFAETETLVTVEKGPFYAVKYVARNLSSLGGVRINERIEAIDAEGNPIPGLYVAGADAGGMYGKAYVDFEGGTLGFAYTSGRLAGENAASYIDK